MRCWQYGPERPHLRRASLRAARTFTREPLSVHLIQVLLPLYDNDGVSLPSALFARVAEELTDHFGGLTAFTRAPAQGIWKEGAEPGATSRDEIVIYEVMAVKLELRWWKQYRGTLERRFKQDVVVVRAQTIRLL
jgi:hypothetical protein